MNLCYLLFIKQQPKKAPCGTSGKFNACAQSVMFAGKQWGQRSLLGTTCIRGPTGTNMNPSQQAAAQLGWTTALGASCAWHLQADYITVQIGTKTRAGLEEIYSKKKTPNHVKMLCLNIAFLSSAIFYCYGRTNFNIKSVSFLIMWPKLDRLTSST